MVDNRFQNYFVSNGKRYYTGTIFMTEISNYPYSGRKLAEAIFVCYDIEQELYIYKVVIPNHDLQTNFAPEKKFYQAIAYITNKVDETVCVSETRKMNDSEISGLTLGWAWYIFLMLLSILFKDVIGLWIFISIVFFRWRKNKINKEGTYVEW